MDPYQNLIVWQKAVDLVIEIYKLTELFPRNELFALTNQIRRSAVSIPSNIAEGSRRGTPGEFRRFLLIAYGSGGELETQIIIAKKLNYGKCDDYNKIDKLLDEIMRILNKLIKKFECV